MERWALCNAWRAVEHRVPRYRPLINLNFAPVVSRSAPSQRRILILVVFTHTPGARHMAGMRSVWTKSSNGVQTTLWRESSGVIASRTVPFDKSNSSVASVGGWAYLSLMSCCTWRTLPAPGSDEPGESFESSRLTGLKPAALLSGQCRPPFQSAPAE